MFQEQVRQALGENYLNETMGPNGTRRTVPASGNARNQPAAGNTHPQPDMGILKALNSMGSAAKRNLSNLAQGFSSSSSNNNASTTSRGGFGGGSPPPAGGAVRRGSGSGSGPRRKKGQFDDLDDVSCLGCSNTLHWIVHQKTFKLSFLYREYYRTKRVLRLSPFPAPREAVGRDICCRTTERVRPIKMMTMIWMV